MSTDTFSPKSWGSVGLAVLPGLFALAVRSGLFWPLFGARIAQPLAEGGLVALCGVLVIAGFVRTRQAPTWSYVALGMIIFYAAGMLLLAEQWARLHFLDEASPLWDMPAWLLLVSVLAALGAFSLYRVRKSRGAAVPRSGWVLLGLVTLVVVVDIIISANLDRNPNLWMAVLAHLGFMLPWMILILSPVAVGLLLARRNGLLAGLMVAGFDYAVVDIVRDPNYGILIHTSNQTASLALSCIPAAFLLLASPLWVLRARSTRGRAWGLLLPQLIALAAISVLRAVALRGTAAAYSIDSWLGDGLFAAQLLVPLGLAMVMYNWIQHPGQSCRTDAPAEGAGHRRTDRTAERMELSSE
jgi:hypothetical protein